MSVEQKNPDWFKQLVGRMKGRDQLAIGFPLGTSGTSTAYPDGTPVVMVAAINQFGSNSRGIPARDFMTPGGVLTMKKTAPIIKKLIPKINEGTMTRKQALELLGVVAVGEFQEAITDLDEPANAPATIKAKKSSKPLIDTGLMRQTLTYVVRE